VILKVQKSSKSIHDSFRVVEVKGRKVRDDRKLRDLLNLDQSLRPAKLTARQSDTAYITPRLPPRRTLKLPFALLSLFPFLSPQTILPLQEPQGQLSIILERYQLLLLCFTPAQDVWRVLLLVSLAGFVLNFLQALLDQSVCQRSLVCTLGSKS